MRLTEFRSFLLMGAVAAFATMFFVVIPHLEATNFPPEMIAENTTSFLISKWIASLAAAALMCAAALGIHKAINKGSG